MLFIVYSKAVRKIRCTALLLGLAAVAVFSTTLRSTYAQVRVEQTPASAKSAKKRIPSTRAKNVILFLGDAGGIPTLHAASIMAHDKANGLFIYSMPHLALMDTSAADAWVTDSAAGMSAIVTGQKTNNGVLSQSAAAVRGKVDGEKLQTILEYAEEHGLSTGVVVNTPVTDATGAACYAHINNRMKTAEIFSQLLSPGFGDGVDVIAGPGRQQIQMALKPLGMDPESELKTKGYLYCQTPDEIPSSARRVAALFDTQSFDLPLVVRRAIDILSRNPKGFFLMVECDMHTDKIQAGLERSIVMDGMVKEAAERMKNDTLIIFTADHSFDLRVRAGQPGQPLLPPPTTAEGASTANPNLRMDNGHTGEQVLVAARGRGAERVHGFITNADLFRIMMAAYRWTPKR
jgi:alkaline phosphatase